MFSNLTYQTKIIDRLVDLKLEYILNEQDVNFLLTEIERNFPNFVAGIITDRHGFPLAAKTPPNFHIHESILALSAIEEKRDFIKDSSFIQVKRNLDKSENFKLFLLLHKSKKLVHRFKKLKDIIKKQVIF